MIYVYVCMNILMSDKWFSSTYQMDEIRMFTVRYESGKQIR